MMRARSIRACTTALAAMAVAAGARGEPVPVRHQEGLVHGFLSLKTLEGRTIVTSRLVFHFSDGSLQEETAVFEQARVFRLVSDRLVQRGPSFPHPMDVSIERSSGQVVVHHEEDGRTKVDTSHMDLPEDLANGLIPILLKNARGDGPPQSLAFVAATPAPRLLKLEVGVDGQQPFSVAGSKRTATRYVLKPKLGGLTGLLAPLLGKQPPDSHVWILDGEAPAFLRAEQPLYLGGPMVRIELASPVWPDQDRD